MIGLLVQGTDGVRGSVFVHRPSHPRVSSTNPFPRTVVRGPPGLVLSCLVKGTRVAVKSRVRWGVWTGGTEFCESWGVRDGSPPEFVRKQGCFDGWFIVGLCEGECWVGLSLTRRRGVHQMFVTEQGCRQRRPQR